MRAERDPPDALRALRALYNRLEPQDPSELDAQDRATRASVEWMQQAYRSLTPLQAQADLHPVRHSGPHSVSRWTKAAAAAFLLVGIGALVLEVRSKARSIAEEGTRAMAAAEEAEPFSPVPPVQPVEPQREQGQDAPAIAFLGPDRVEMRSGPVRLILLTNAPNRASNRAMDSDQGELR